MTTDRAPFDIWDGEDLERSEPIEADAAEVVALRVEVDDDPRWSDLTDPAAGDGDGSRPHYFADEEPETTRPRPGGTGGLDEREPDLEELLEHQHYSFREEHRPHAE